VLPAINLRFIIFISVLGLTITFSCKTTTKPPSLTLDKLIQDTSTKKIIIDTADKYITRVVDVGGDTNVGGHYEFYKNGRLKNYNFIYKTTYDTSKKFIQRFHDSLVFFASYGEAYDSLGHLDSVYKTPLVYKIVNNRKINDTIDFVFYFFAMDKQYKDVIAKTSNNQTFSLKPEKSNPYTNMYCDQIKVPWNGVSKIQVIVYCDYLNKSTGHSEQFNDTTTFDKMRNAVIENGR
jgi:hypothetical protein